MQHRQERVGDQIRAELSQLILRELHDPRIGFVTVSEVRMSPDLKIARVFVSVYGTEEEESETLEALRHAGGYLRREIGERLPLRYTPELRFEADRTLKRTARLEAIFDELRDEEDPEKEADAAEGARDDGEDEGDRAAMERVEEAIRQHERFVIASHEDPDGDSLGSSMALALGLEQLGKSSRVVIAQAVPRNLSRLPEVDRVETVSRCPQDCPVALLVECSSFARTGLDGFEGLLSVNIDHHANNPRFADVNWIDADVAATGVMIHRLLERLGVEMTPEIASHLYVTVLTDTGSFRYSNTDAEALRLSAELVEAGPIDPSAVASAVYDNVPVSRVRLIGEALDSLVLEDGGAIAWMVLPSEALNGFPEDPETEGIINFAQSIEGVKVSLLFKEVAEDEFRVSMRSNGEVDVAELAVAFGGGGHPRAAGCPMDGSFREVRGRVLGAVRAELPEGEAPGTTG